MPCLFQQSAGATNQQEEAEEEGVEETRGEAGRGMSSDETMMGLCEEARRRNGMGSGRQESRNGQLRMGQRAGGAAAAPQWWSGEEMMMEWGTRVTGSKKDAKKARSRRARG